MVYIEAENLEDAKRIARHNNRIMTPIMRRNNRIKISSGRLHKKDEYKFDSAKTGR